MTGGALGLAELAQLAGLRDRDHRATEHRPTDHATLRCAAVELRQRGFTDRDIADTLELSEAAVRALLRG